MTSKTCKLEHFGFYCSKSCFTWSHDLQIDNCGLLLLWISGKHMFSFPLHFGPTGYQWLFRAPCCQLCITQREDYREKVGSENTTDPKKDILQYSPDTSASQRRRTQGARDFPLRIVGEGSDHWGNIHAPSTGIGNRGCSSCYWFI